MLTDLVFSKTEYILNNNRYLIAHLISERKRFEGWLQIEILNHLLSEGSLIKIEKPYPEGNTRCDFWKDEGAEVESWVELKLCVTNYCSNFTTNLSPRPITNQVDQIIMDIEKLNQISKTHNGAVIVIAYPLPKTCSEYMPWKKHLSRIGSSASSWKKLFSIEVLQNETSAYLEAYLFYR